MDQIHEFVDRRQKAWCIQCGRSISALETNADHVPSKTLLQKPYPANLPVVGTCIDCNNAFSADEEYLFLFLQCVLAGTTDPSRQTDSRVARALLRHEKLRTRIEASRNEETIHSETRSVWYPEPERVNRVILKNARGHAFYELGEPMLDAPAHIWAAPLETMTSVERAEFEAYHADGLWPEVGSRMLTRIVTGQNLDNGWVELQEGVYRYSVAQQGLVRSALYEYLATEVLWTD